MRNLIRAEMLPTEYCHEPHLVITVDGTPLDPAERKVVWDRIQQKNGANINVPVLICPDDLDLWCSVVLADTTFSADDVTWHALGVHAGGSDGLPDSIGCEVNWFAGVGSFHFSRSDYDACVAKFRLYLEVNGR